MMSVDDRTPLPAVLAGDLFDTASWSELCNDPIRSVTSNRAVPRWWRSAASNSFLVGQ